MKSFLSLLILLLMMGGNAYAGTGSYCNPEDARKHFEVETKSELCLTSKDENYQTPRIRWVGVRGYGKPYPSCKDFGYLDYAKYERDFWGNLKCGPDCNALIDFLYLEHLKQLCGKDFKHK